MAGKTDYSKGKIYCIRSHQCEEVYVGSTCSMLSRRMYEHRSNFKLWKEGKKNYVSSFDILKYEDAYIELLELYPCTMKIELLAREGKYIRELSCVNKIVAGRTRAEYRQENKDIIRARNAEQYQKKKDTRIAKQTEYYHENKETILAKAAEYRQKNREKFRLISSENYLKRRETILAKVHCPCGSIISRSSLSVHKKSKKHRISMFELHNIFNHLCV